MKKRKGIILAGGKGSRLYPVSKGVSKQLIPIYDKPMIYYPLSTLMMAGIKQILIICNPHEIQQFKALLGDGSELGLELEYLIQPSPDGIAQALILAERYLDGASSALILGDNIFYGHSLEDKLINANANHEKTSLFAYHVQNPEQYGVVEFDKGGRVLSIEEKPRKPKTKFAVVGLYFYSEDAPYYAKQLTPSARGELEITDLNSIYLDLNKLRVEKLGRGYSWLDTGTHDSSVQSASFIQTIEKRQGLKISCPEEVAWRKGFIDTQQLEKLVQAMPTGDYRGYFERLLVEFDSENF